MFFNEYQTRQATEQYDARIRQFDEDAIIGFFIGRAIGGMIRRWRGR